MKAVYSKAYEKWAPTIQQLVEQFDEEGVFLYSGGRNTVKYFPLEDITINIKSFKVPNLINKFVYRFIRKSKARRSFEYAERLLALGIGSPDPIAYIEKHSLLGITHSYYCSKHLGDSFTIRTVIDDEQYPDAENIIRCYTRLIFKMHEAQIYFKDNSPGNFLIEKKGNDYLFYLVDLNRMDFDKPLTLALRMGNFSRISQKEKVLALINDEYAQLIGAAPSETFQLLQAQSALFWQQLEKKKAYKARWKQLKAGFK